MCLGILFFISVTVSASILHYLRLHPELELSQHMPKMKMEGGFFLVTSTFAALISMGFFISGIGILKMKRWARRLIVISAYSYILSFTINISLNISMAKEAASRMPPQFVQSTYQTYILSFIMGLFFVCLVALPAIIYFSKTEVKKQFCPE